MKIKSVNQFESSRLSLIDYDLIIVSSGYESRCTYISQTFKLKSNSKICFAFKNYENNLARKKNDRFFRTEGYRVFPFNSDDDSAIFDLIKRLVDKFENRELNILVDYSCMTRVWYSSILLFFKLLDSRESVNIFFCYSLAEFTPAPKSVSKNIHVGPIRGFSGISTPTIPTALVIGLGYIPQRAYGLVEYLDAVPFLFYTNSSDGNLYSKEVEANNHDLLTQVSDENIFTYSITDQQNAFYNLTDLCNDLRGRYRVILAPCGPKPFTLLCLLASVLIDDLDVWRISAGKKEKPTDRQADGRTTVLKVSFV